MCFGFSFFFSIMRSVGVVGGYLFYVFICRKKLLFFEFLGCWGIYRVFRGVEK